MSRPWSVVMWTKSALSSLRPCGTNTTSEKSVLPAESAANTRSPILIQDMGVAPTDSTVTVSDPAKQPFLSVDESGVLSCFTGSALMLGAGVVDASLGFDDEVVCVEGVTTGFGDGVVCVEGSTTGFGDGVVCVEGATTGFGDGVVSVEGSTTGFDDRVVCVEGATL